MTARPIAFSLTFVALFALSFAFMSAVDALPDPVGSVGTSNGTGPSQVIQISNVEIAAPVRVAAKKIGLDVSVSNPADTNIDVLNEALLDGAVRYPTSALLGAEGTVLLFGHSSHLPIVRNQNFKAFNNIEKLKAGDTVSVYSGTTEYRYAVTSVRLANAEEDVVQLPSNGKYLALVTCDNFGTKSDRYVVEAEFVAAYAL